MRWVTDRRPGSPGARLAGRERRAGAGRAVRRRGGVRRVARPASSAVRPASARRRSGGRRSTACAPPATSCSSPGRPRRSCSGTMVGLLDLFEDVDAEPAVLDPDTDLFDRGRAVLRDAAPADRRPDGRAGDRRPPMARPDLGALAALRPAPARGPTGRWWSRPSAPGPATAPRLPLLSPGANRGDHARRAPDRGDPAGADSGRDDDLPSRPGARPRAVRAATRCTPSSSPARPTSIGTGWRHRRARLWTARCRRASRRRRLRSGSSCRPRPPSARRARSGWMSRAVSPTRRAARRCDRPRPAHARRLAAGALLPPAARVGRPRRHGAGRPPRAPRAASPTW